MANYPTLTQLIGTTREAMSGIRVNRAESGKPRFAKYSTQDWFVFRVLHYVDSTDLASLQSHYSAHRMLEFDFLYTATNETYKVQYGASPRLQTMEGDDGWVVENLLVGTGRIPFAHVSLRLTSSLAVNIRANKRSPAVTIPLTSTLTAVGAHARKATVVVSAPTTITVARNVGHKGTATVTSASSVIAEGNKLAARTVTVSSTSTLDVVKTTDRPKDVTVSSTSSVTVSGTRPGTVSITETSSVSAVGAKNASRDVTVTATDSVTATGTNP